MELTDDTEHEVGDQFMRKVKGKRTRLTWSSPPKTLRWPRRSPNGTMPLHTLLSSADENMKELQEL